jgi:minor extracellular serine protease Vpr
MNLPLRSVRVFTISLLTLSISMAGVLTQTQRAKLHPFFKGIVAKHFPQLLKSGNPAYHFKSAIDNSFTARYDAIIYTQDANSVRAIGVPVHSEFSEFITTQVTASDLIRLVNIESIKYIDKGSINYPQLDLSVPETGASLLHSGFINNTSYKGAGAIVLIYDTGIDWKHLDFRKSDTTKSRVLYIWDQTLTAGGSETAPAGFTYGVEYTQAQIENELDGSPAGFVREKDIHGHGTHVAGTAAGNGLSYNSKYVGMAPDADIIVVKGGDGSFSETKMIDGLTYAQNKAASLGKPIVVNWSIGGHGGSHDGKRPYEVAVDNFVSNPGRVVCISAGNSGGSLMHFSGTVTSSTTDTIKIIVPTSRTSGNNNDYFFLDCWTLDNSAVSVVVKSPTGTLYTFASDSETDSSAADGGIYVWNNVNLQNSHREFDVEVYDAIEGVLTSGTWSIILKKTSGSSSFDAWLVNSSFGGSSATLINGNTNKTVSMPGTSNGAITVGSYATRPIWYAYNNTGWSWGTQDNISSFSSIGPTADGRIKPDISSPGQMIVAALSSNVDTTGASSDIVLGNKHQVMAGTSMACPHVTGGTALLLGSNPSLTAAQIKSLFTSTANSDAYATSLPNNTWGYGKLDVVEAMAKSLYSGGAIARNTISYDGTNSNATFWITGSTKIAVRFSPSVNGTLTGVQLNITTPNNRPIAGNGNLVCQVYSNNSGSPGIAIGTQVNHPLNRLSAGTNNYIQMTSAGITITSGTEYFIVMSTANATDTVIVRTENVTTGTHSYTYNGSAWSVQSYNIRMRSIITRASGLNSINAAQQLQPEIFRLGQNYPNPFNPSTQISYNIPKSGLVKLQIFDILGRSVATLVNSEQEAGDHYVVWNGISSNGALASSGVYFYRLESGSFSKTERMLLLK